MADAREIRRKETNVRSDYVTSRAWALEGPSIQIDPLFPYYQNRSADSIAEELQLAGYRTVHYFVVNESQVNAELIDSFHHRGMAVWALVIGNGTFSTSHLPPEWPTWKMGLLKELNDGFERFSPFSKEYVQWKKEAVSRMLREYPFDGIEIAEPYFPEWDGIRRGVYGDIGIAAEQAFLEKYGLPVPEFLNRFAAHYYKKTPDAYAKWIDFRVDAVNALIDEIINGSGGAREARQDILVATWSLAVDGGAVSTLRLKEWQGLDAISMIGRVKPDLHVLQTHWPDWMKRNLKADYPGSYESFAAPIRAAFPELPLGIQADVGSRANMVKDRGWLNRFQNTVYDLGYQTWTAYEYHLGGYMYQEPPVPLAASIQGETEVVVSFNKRLDPDSTGGIVTGGQDIDEAGKEAIRMVESIVDGNRLWLRFNRLPEIRPFDIEIGHAKDTPSLWHVKGKRANETPSGTRISVSD
ncbi:N-acyl-D-glucosamine 2-epimerase [Paenibacillus sp. HJL G12]|uniref:N-acyl-D-glucosamine 2-epimerase n=1 Tax=Paenibacillus dendrobii TaxID=2691084 RepID=A0A7X3LKU5_9BACL|nr:N-acyl-D-glucosamine 2-epimerase [Paenibacillus dendrobii]MWV46958.1 N-acyl-D-glucosamine 2-epimerase [Paenibacillus dendrobii]